MRPTVAIIMRSKDEMPHIVSALEGLQQQTCRDFELYAVDSGSTDGSLQQLRQSCGKDNLREIPPESYSPGKVLNEAIALTTHRIIVLLNADAIPQSNDWLERLIAPLLTGTADAVFSRQVARPDARFIVTYDYERAYDPEKVHAIFFSAVACAFNRELWEQHPFRSEGYAEDAEWARRCLAGSARIQMVAESVVEHSHNYTLRQLYRKRYRQALTLADRPCLFTQVLKCFRETVRDLQHAILKLKPLSIPYNILYRITIHAGHLKGLRDSAL
jgi:rhamnosyltransferase